MPSWGPDLVNKLISISISIRKNCIRIAFCLFCKKNFYPALFTLPYFIILVVATVASQIADSQFAESQIAESN
jgi:hypothetical protein